MRFGIVVFPGSNSGQDVHHVLKNVMGQDTRFIWHKDRDLTDVDCVILPGGSTYGDYLRPGALARLSPVVEEVVSFANKGGKVVGICNGFQVLLEAGLLPGAMLRNESLKFLCKDVHVRVETSDTPFTQKLPKGTVLRMPIAHAEGNYFLDDEALARLEGNGQVVFRYVEADGSTTQAGNPNGARNHIAGIVNEQRNVLGLMTHPERAAESILGGADGRRFFESLIGA